MMNTPFFLTLFTFLAQQVSGTPLEECDSLNDGLKIKTKSFTVQGSIFPNSTDVRFFGNIPYAEPPVGPLRFKAPVSVKPRPGVINGTWFGPSCMQNTKPPSKPSLAADFQPGFLLSPGQPISEDCLTLNVWAPKGAKKGDKLPVIIWIHGGGFTSNGEASPYKYGDRLVRNQNVIVVSINYRLHMFGFSKSAALNGTDLNSGLLDQRKAVEWVHHNIHAFGGDAKRMTLFGQSAGAQSVDLYSYAYRRDSLVHALIANSGQAPTFTYEPDPSGSNFTFFAKQLGCNGTTSAVFVSMQSKPAAEIMKAVAVGYAATANSTTPPSFYPVADDQVIFFNYTDRQERGLFARIPIIFSSANNKGGSTVPFTPEGPSGAEKVAEDAFTNLVGCGAASSVLGRRKFGVPVWRVRYFGEWPNLNPYDWLGAYHGSDLPMAFGTSNLTAPDTELETSTSNYYQDALVAFAKDPLYGLSQYGWPMYDPEKTTLVKMGNGTAKAVLTKGDDFDGACGRSMGPARPML